MRTRLCAAVGALLIAMLVRGETNGPRFVVATNRTDVDRFIKMNAERARRGESPLPIQITPQAEKELVDAGVLPPSDADDSLVSLRFNRASGTHLNIALFANDARG